MKVTTVPSGLERVLPVIVIIFRVIWKPFVQMKTDMVNVKIFSFYSWSREKCEAKRLQTRSGTPNKILNEGIRNPVSHDISRGVDEHENYTYVRRKKTEVALPTIMKEHNSVEGYRTNKQFWLINFTKVSYSYIVKTLKLEVVHGRLEIALSKLCSTTCNPAGLLSANLADLHIICLVAHL